MFFRLKSRLVLNSEISRLKYENKRLKDDIENIIYQGGQKDIKTEKEFNIRLEQEKKILEAEYNEKIENMRRKLHFIRDINREIKHDYKKAHESLEEQSLKLEKMLCIIRPYIERIEMYKSEVIHSNKICTKEINDFISGFERYKNKVQNLLEE